MAMRRRRDLITALALVGVALGTARAEPAASAPPLFDAGSFGNRKEPVTVTADKLEYDYKANVIVYRGDVVATQGDTKLRSDTLTVTLAAADKSDGAPDAPAKGGQRLQEIVAVGNVRIDDGTRWATGGRAVFEQSNRTFVLTETPVLHDGSNEVAGDRVVVFLDENRSVVEGGRKRVKAVLYPSNDGGLAGTAGPKEHPRASAGSGAPAVKNP
jgi:lipopolysaccharide export system protein LptA